MLNWGTAALGFREPLRVWRGPVPFGGQVAAYAAEAKATGKPLAISMIVRPGQRKPIGFDAAARQAIYVSLSPVKPMSRDEAVARLRKIVAAYGLQWTAAVPNHAWDEMGCINTLLTEHDRCEALGLPTRTAKNQ
jgi:hypothetical protein